MACGFRFLTDIQRGKRTTDVNELKGKKEAGQTRKGVKAECSPSSRVDVGTIVNPLIGISCSWSLKYAD